MKYGGFPIFTRRYPSYGIENFAFDALLGKPCLITAHHDIFRRRTRGRLDFVDRLNSLHWKLVWRPLGETVRRSFRTRRLEDGTRAIEIFGSEMLLENSDTQPLDMVVLKRETDPGLVEAVSVNGRPVKFSLEHPWQQ